MPELPLGDLVQHHAALKPPEALAAIYPDRQLTWRALGAAVNQRTRSLKALGVGPGCMVTVALANSSQFLENVFAVWKAGATPNIVNPRLPAGELREIVALARPRLIIGEIAASDVGVPVLSPSADVSAYDDSPFDGAVSPYWKAMTSGGSTGRPKVVVDHLPAQADPDASLLQSLGLRPDSVMINAGPLYHNAPFVFTTRALAYGCKVVGMARFDPEAFLSLVETHKVTFAPLVPTMMHRIWSLPPRVRDRYDLSSLEQVWHMAAPCAPWLKAAWIDWLGPERVFEIYGGTERVGSTVIRGDEWLRKPGSVGRAAGVNVAGKNQIRAFRADGGACEPGEVGELYFWRSDPTPTYHYLGAEPRLGAAGWESLGDLGHVDDEGYVFIADRRTDLILRGGANIYPAEVEAALDAHPDVASSVVIGLPSEDLGQQVHALVEVRAGADLGIAALHAHLSLLIEPHKLPETYELLREPLRDDAGKARRGLLRDQRLAWLSHGRDFAIPSPRGGSRSPDGVERETTP